MIAGSDLASSRSFLALSGFMLNSLATCSTLFSSIIWHLHFWPQHRYVQIAKISSAYLPYRTVKYAVVNVIVFTVNSNRVHRLSGFPVRCLSLLGLCHLFHLYPCLRRLMPRRSRHKLRSVHQFPLLRLSSSLLPAPALPAADLTAAQGALYH